MANANARDGGTTHDSGVRERQRAHHACCGGGTVSGGLLAGRDESPLRLGCRNTFHRKQQREGCEGRNDVRHGSKVVREREKKTSIRTSKRHNQTVRMSLVSWRYDGYDDDLSSIRSGNIPAPRRPSFSPIG